MVQTKSKRSIGKYWRGKAANFIEHTPFLPADVYLPTVEDFFRRISNRIKKGIDILLTGYQTSRFQRVARHLRGLTTPGCDACRVETPNQYDKEGKDWSNTDPSSLVNGRYQTAIIVSSLCDWFFVYPETSLKRSRMERVYRYRRL